MKHALWVRGLEEVRQAPGHRGALSLSLVLWGASEEQPDPLPGTEEGVWLAGEPFSVSRVPDAASSTQQGLVLTSTTEAPVPTAWFWAWFLAA